LILNLIDIHGSRLQNQWEWEWCSCSTSSSCWCSCSYCCWNQNV